MLRPQQTGRGRLQYRAGSTPASLTGELRQVLLVMARAIRALVGHVYSSAIGQSQSPDQDQSQGVGKYALPTEVRETAESQSQSGGYREG